MKDTVLELPEHFARTPGFSSFTYLHHTVAYLHNACTMAHMAHFKQRTKREVLLCHGPIRVDRKSLKVVFQRTELRLNMTKQKHSNIIYVLESRLKSGKRGQEHFCIIA